MTGRRRAHPLYVPPDKHAEAQSELVDVLAGQPADAAGRR